jgi:hypothetical protein
MAPGNRAIEMLAAFYAEREKERMGLGADTIEAFTEGPYRRAEQMRVVDREKIEAIVKLRKCGVPSAYLYFVANLLPRMDVFEACAAGTITAEESGLRSGSRNAQWRLGAPQPARRLEGARRLSSSEQGSHGSRGGFPPGGGQGRGSA